MVFKLFQGKCTRKLKLETTPFVRKVLLTLQNLQGIKKYHCGVSIKDMESYMIQNFQVDGDTKTQIKIALAQLSTYGTVKVLDRLYSLVGPYAGIAMIPNFCNERVTEMQRIESIYPSMWDYSEKRETTCGMCTCQFHNPCNSSKNPCESSENNSYCKCTKKKKTCCCSKSPCSFCNNRDESDDDISLPQCKRSSSTNLESNSYFSRVGQSNKRRFRCKSECSCRNANIKECKKPRKRHCKPKSKRTNCRFQRSRSKFPRCPKHNVCNKCFDNK